DDWRAASAHDLHELRQRVVVHRYQMEIVKPLWPRLGKSWVREAQKLRDRLGKYNDLAVLARYAEPHQPLARWRSRLQSVISQRQSQHVANARRLAGRIFAERPKAPATCATDVSTEITRSQSVSTAAVSEKSFNSGPRLRMRESRASASLSPSRSSRCTLMKLTPGMDSSGSSWVRVSERLR